MEKRIDEKSLEKAFSDRGEKETPKMTKETEIGFHQGSLNTLINERNELIRMVQQVDSIIRAHLKRLEELGVKVNYSD